MAEASGSSRVLSRWVLSRCLPNADRGVAPRPHPVHAWCTGLAAQGGVAAAAGGLRLPFRVEHTEATEKEKALWELRN